MRTRSTGLGLRLVLKIGLLVGVVGVALSNAPTLKGIGPKVRADRPQAKTTHRLGQ